MIHSTAPKSDSPVTLLRGNDSSGQATQASRAAEKPPDVEPAQQGPVDRAALDRAAARIGEMLDATDPRLKIEVDAETERVVVKVVQQDSGKIIRQIPPEELLELEKHLSHLKGLLLQEQA